MENQHRKISGYRELTEHEIALMNQIKKHGEALGDLVEQLRTTTGLDQRWVSIGATDLQKGAYGSDTWCSTTNNLLTEKTPDQLNDQG